MTDNAMTDAEFANLIRRVADRRFSDNLARGEYAGIRVNGEHVHDRHVLIHFRNAEAFLREAADRLDAS